MLFKRQQLLSTLLDALGAPAGHTDGFPITHHPSELLDKLERAVQHL